MYDFSDPSDNPFLLIVKYIKITIIFYINQVLPYIIFYLNSML